MAGWDSPDRDLQIWHGTLQADNFKGDGSRLTGLTATGDNLGNHIATQTISGSIIDMTGTISGATIWGDGSNLTGIVGGGGTNLWASYANAVLYPISTTQTISGANLYASGTVSGSYIVSRGDVSGAYIWGDGSKLTGIAGGGGYSESSGALLYTVYQVTSGAQLQKYNQTSGATHVASGSIHYASSAIYTAINAKYNETSGARTYTSYQVTSGAYISHAADTSDPHGVKITQTELMLASGAVTADGDTLSGARLQNIVIGTGSTPPTASNFPRGTIYVQYTP